MIIEGALSVKAVIESQKRVIQHLIMDKNKDTRDSRYILRLCEKNKVPVILEDRATIDELASGKTHGGIIVECGPRIYETKSVKNEDLVLVVEGIEDPFNLGMIFRSAYIMGVSTVMTPIRDFGLSEPVLVKASAGTSERLRWMSSELINQYSDFQVVAAQRHPEAVSLSMVDFKKPTVLCIGGEKRGLSKEILAQSDVYMTINYPSHARIALSAVSATAMSLYEISRQRMETTHE